MTGRPLRLAVVVTHPIQYHAPWYRALVGAGLDLRVVFGVLPDARQQAVGFGGEFQWDVPVLEGYRWVQVPSWRGRPTLGTFRGLLGRGVGRVLSALAPDAVLLTGWNSAFLVQALGASVALGLPRLLRAESNALRRRAAWKAPGHRALLAAFDAFVAIGSANRRFYETHGVAPDRIVDGGYFVDTEHFEKLVAQERPRRDVLRRRLGVPEGAACLLFVGKLQGKKRPLDFLAAVGRVAAMCGRGAAHALVVGTGELEAEMRHRASQEGIPVTFVGFLNQREIGSAYAAADALVLPSDAGETWGLVVNEAMQFGMPVVVSDEVGCGPDLVEEGVTGHQFPVGDVEALAARLARLVAEPGHRRFMGTHARERVRQFTPARGATAVIEALAMAGISGG